MKYYKGSISIYFAFSIVLIVSVVLSVTEIARVNCQRLYLQIATDSAIDSMLSLYHRKLYEYYNIYGVEYRTNDLLTTEYLSYMNPYFFDDENNINVANWYTARINEENIALNTKLITDDMFFEREIIDYMKYKMIGKVISYLGKDVTINEATDIEKLCENVKDIYNQNKKSELYSEIYGKYFNFSGNIKKLENFAKKIPNYIRDTNSDINSLRSVSSGGSLSNAENVYSKVNSVINSIDKLKSTLESYKKEMKNFREVVNESKRKYENDRASGLYEISDEINEFVEDEFNVFISFVDENSEMNRKVEYKLEESDSVRNSIRSIQNNVNYYANALSRVESELAEAKRMKGEDRDKEYIKDLTSEKNDLEDEFSDYIKEMKEDVKDISIEILELETSVDTHSSEENLLNKLISFKDGILINLILSDDEIKKISTDEARYNSFDILSENKNISINKILLSEYALDKFNYYNKKKNNEITKSGSESLEVEMLLNGKFSDIENIKTTINSILLIRIAMNVLHIYKSREKRQMARSFSYTIFGGFSRLLAETMFLLIISAWGTAQSIADVKKLLKNYRVNFMHDDVSWTVNISSILDIAGGQNIGVEEKDDNGLALSYKDYLRLLLINKDQSVINERMASIMEYNVKKEQENFDFEKLVAAFDIKNAFYCKHFFTNFIFESASDVKLYDEYIVETNGYKSFIK